jgi:hypothetical protein
MASANHFTSWLSVPPLACATWKNPLSSLLENAFQSRSPRSGQLERSRQARDFLEPSAFFIRRAPGKCGFRWL